MGKTEIVLIDTSSWIEALRSAGRRDIRERVLKLMIEGRAAWCDMVLVELWNGARGAYEKQKLSELEEEITCLQTTPKVWQTARSLAPKCRQAGHTVPSADLVIAACALTYNAQVEHCDNHIDFILKVHSQVKRKDS
ncbi:MAG: PIN domain-containing protein [Nitrospirae bacterium]|nr:PIN domain-containing protein [Nitrospirota bacterium]